MYLDSGLVQAVMSPYACCVFVQRSPGFSQTTSAEWWCSWHSWRAWWRVSSWSRTVKRSWQRSWISAQRRSLTSLTSTKTDSCSSVRYMSLCVGHRPTAMTEVCFLVQVDDANCLLFPLWQILTHSRVRDGIWLTPENLREIYAGLKADKNNDGKRVTLMKSSGFGTFFFSIVFQHDNFDLFCKCQVIFSNKNKGKRKQK